MTAFDRRIARQGEPSAAARKLQMQNAELTAKNVQLTSLAQQLNQRAIHLSRLLGAALHARGDEMIVTPEELRAVEGAQLDVQDVESDTPGTVRVTLELKPLIIVPGQEVPRVDA